MVFWVSNLGLGEQSFVIYHTRPKWHTLGITEEQKVLASLIATTNRYSGKLDILCGEINEGIVGSLEILSSSS